MTDLFRTHTDTATFLELKPEPWTRSPSCAETDPDLFFPDRKAGDSAAAAKRICHACPVQAECLEYAVRTNQTIGIWGGRAVRQIREARRRQT